MNHMIIYHVYELYSQFGDMSCNTLFTPRYKLYEVGGCHFDVKYYQTDSAIGSFHGMNHDSNDDFSLSQKHELPS